MEGYDGEWEKKGLLLVIPFQAHLASHGCFDMSQPGRVVWSHWASYSQSKSPSVGSSNPELSLILVVFVHFFWGLFLAIALPAASNTKWHPARVARLIERNSTIPTNKKQVVSPMWWGLWQQKRSHIFFGQRISDRSRSRVLFLKSRSQFLDRSQFMELKITLNERTLILEGPIFHWTMIVGGRVFNYLTVRNPKIHGPSRGVFDLLGQSTSRDHSGGLPR